MVVHIPCMPLNRALRVLLPWALPPVLPACSVSAPEAMSGSISIGLPTHCLRVAYTMRLYQHPVVGESRICSYPDVWRRLHPAVEDVYTVWSEKTSARSFNEVHCQPHSIPCPLQILVRHMLPLDVLSGLSTGCPLFGDLNRSMLAFA